MGDLGSASHLIGFGCDADDSCGSWFEGVADGPRIMSPSWGVGMADVCTR